MEAEISSAVQIWTIIKEIIVEVVRLLGPPLIAAFFAYRAATTQAEKRIDEVRIESEKNIAEISQQHKFEASKIIFETQKDSLDNLKESYSNIVKDVIDVGDKLIDHSRTDGNELRKVLAYHVNTLEFTLGFTKENFEHLKCKYPMQWANLEKLSTEFLDHKRINSTNYLAYTISIKSLYDIIVQCEQIIVTEKMKETLSGYVEN